MNEEGAASMNMEEHIRELAEEWIRLFSSAVESMTGEKPVMSWQRAAGAPDS